MKVYFSASRFYRDQYDEVYKLITGTLKKEGYSVFDNTLDKWKKGKEKLSQGQKFDFHKEIINSLDKSDFSVFEASFPSTIHIGHEITVAIEKGKPVIVLYSDDDGKEPMLFKGVSTDKVIWVAYNKKNLQDLLHKAIEDAKKLTDVRFNFFVSPKILNYLDWVAQKRMIPRSVFLRNLIEREMKKEKDFK